jgi:exopolysaccharide biosynthesis polyprenyl glycosylphosphotransferase
MNATAQPPLLRGFELHDELKAIVDERTLEILDHRRRTAIVRRRGWLVRRMLLGADVIGLLAAMLFAEAIVGTRSDAGSVDSFTETLLLIASIPGWIIVAKLYGLYDKDEERTDHSTTDDLSGVFHVITIGTWLFWASAYLTGVARPTALKLVVFWVTATLLVSLGRATARSLSRRSMTYLQNTVILGAGDVGQLIAHKLMQHPEYGINLVGFIDDRPKERRDDLDHLALLGGIDRLPTVVRLFDVERVIVAFSNDAREDVLSVVRELNELNVQVDIVPRFFDVVSPGVDLHSVEGLPLIGLRAPRLSRSSTLLKRGLDLAVAGVGLLVLAPFFAAVALAIKLDSAGPVFFHQVRMGARGQTFSIFKFRTMALDADARKAEVTHLNKHARDGGDPRMFKIDDDPRATRLGRVLRRLSIDELPQLWNVLRGEMSLVGPRPLILEEDAHVIDWAERRLDLKPGITGIWQVLGRDGIPFEEMVKLDYVYVTSWNLGGDMRLLLRTIPRVFSAAR